jgi:homoserine kinase
MNPTRTALQRALGVAEARQRVEGLTLEVPASVANLGPGFDALAVAVNLYLRVTVRHVLDGPRNELRCAFGGVRLEGDDYVARTVNALAAREGLDFPALEIDIASEIPMQAGLGSSAAAIVAGLLLFDRLAGPGGRDLLVEGAEFEGHPDNIAAALMGGLTAACRCDDGRVLALSTEWPSEVGFVAVTPESRVKTPDARRVLPEMLTRADAIFNLQRVALLLQALNTRRLDLVREALADRWHQPFRERLVPGLSEALRLEAPGLLGVCLSGSGPTVVALCEGDSGPIERALSDIYSGLRLPCRVRSLVAHNGPARMDTRD